MDSNAERKWWSRALLLSSVLGCARLVGFEDDYYEIDPNRGGRAGQAGLGGSVSGDGAGGVVGGAAGAGAGDSGGAGGEGGTSTPSGGKGNGGSQGGVAGSSAGATSGTAGEGEAGGGDAGDAGTGGAGKGAGGAASGSGGTAGDSGAAGNSGAGAGGSSAAGAAGSSGAGTGGGCPVESAGTGPTSPSCEGLPHLCGADGCSDCCASIAVAGGSFQRDNHGGYPATVSAFSLDRYEVTVGRFRRFVAEYPGNKPEDGAGKNPNVADDPGWEGATWNRRMPQDADALERELGCQQYSYLPTWSETEENDARPINCVTWPVAYAFCIWDGGWLPTEAEWAFAAAGGDEQRLYPWSSGPDDEFITPEHASYQLPNPIGTPDAGACWGDGRLGCDVTDFVPVGSKPIGAGRFGHFELAGNVWEWTRDTFGDYGADCGDCANLTPDPELPRIARGGGYFSTPGLLETDFRLAYPANTADTALGIRCARQLPE